MIKKSNKILVGCLSLLLVLTVGYAIFSDNITINGTATAKGNFDVVATCQAGFSQPFTRINKFSNIISGNPYVYTDNNYKNDSCVVNKNTISFNVDLLQPLAARNFEIKLTNNGTIDAVLAVPEEGFPGSLERCEGDAATGTFSNCKTDFNYNSIIVFDIIGYSLADGIVKTLDYGNETSGEEFVSNFISNDGESTDIILKPSTSIYMRFSAYWDDYEGDMGFAGEGAGSVYVKDTMNLILNFTQPKSN